jgi:hypothetical protein
MSDEKPKFTVRAEVAGDQTVKRATACPCFQCRVHRVTQAWQNGMGARVRVFVTTEQRDG